MTINITLQLAGVKNHIDCMGLFKTSPCQTKKKSPKGIPTKKSTKLGTLQPNQWHFRELRHLPNLHVSVAEWIPTHARTSALKHGTMTSWSVDDWTHTGLNTVPPAPRKLQSTWPIFCSTRLFQNAVIAGLRERKALWSAAHIQHHKTQSLASPSSKAVSLQLRFIRAARSTYTSKLLNLKFVQTKPLDFFCQENLEFPARLVHFLFKLGAASTNLGFIGKAKSPALREVAPRPIPWTRWP